MIKSVILLSDKSSGSSAVQRELIGSGNLRMADWTPNAQNETLYWIYASAILGLKQEDMIYSNLPIERSEALEKWNQLLDQNLPNGFQKPKHVGVEQIFVGWRLLADRFGPVFFEKSPHHLHNWSSIQLMLDCDRKYPDVDFKFIGLVRNPMDTIYSHWTRWNVDPNEKQFEWMSAYKNLIRLQEMEPSKMIVVRYEDLVLDPNSISKVYDFLNLEKTENQYGQLHAGSVSKWVTDASFGFQLDSSVVEFATSLGYLPEQLHNVESWKWPIIRLLNKRSHRYMMLRKSGLKLLREVRKSLKS